MLLKALLVMVTILSYVFLLPQHRAHASAEKELELKFVGRYQSGIFGPDRSAAESLTHDPETQRLFIVNVAQNRIDVLDMSDPKHPEKLFFYRSCTLRWQRQQRRRLQRHRRRRCAECYQD
jgi:hypothetical protein